MDIGEVFLVNEEPHIVIETDLRGVIKRSEPLKDYICRTRIIEHEGQRLSIADAVNRMSLKYIDTLNK